MLYVTLHNTPTTVCIFACKMFSQNQPVFAYSFATRGQLCKETNGPFLSLAQCLVEFPAHVL